VRLFSPGFPPDDVFAHPRHEAAQRALPDLILQLRAVASVKDGYEFQQELTARLSPYDLPSPPARSTSPPWCGERDQAIRMLDYHGAAPMPAVQVTAARHASVADRRVARFRELRTAIQHWRRMSLTPDQGERASPRSPLNGSRWTCMRHKLSQNACSQAGHAARFWGRIR